ncbi:hypothetical protein MANES_01G269200v8 [Manihot esculenta]|uniref:Uncharacterized protein n=1 Tax=Manihot esculenta TaxID=3983 RepID=A0A2C9WPF7_MANES|nr:hypothetical protein MANES_01G269200v8 [Manihot esculenta]
MPVDHSAALRNHSTNEQTLNLTVALHGINFSVMMVLCPLLQIKYQSESAKTSLEKKSGIMVAFYVVLISYVLTVMKEINLLIQNSVHHAIVIRNLSLYFGSLANVLLVSIIEPLFGVIVFAIWFYCFVIAAYASHEEWYETLMGRGSTEEQNRPPV